LLHGVGKDLADEVRQLVGIIFQRHHVLAVDPEQVGCVEHE